MIKLKEKINNADKIIIISGAGLSSASGIPTFRDSGGLWDTYKIEDVATIAAFKNNPSLAWSFYDKRKAELPKVPPNEAHLQLSILQQNKKVFLLTQNVDNLLERAGCVDVTHLHGILTNTKCNGCDYQLYNDNIPREHDYICPQCGDVLRPSVTLFGEMLPIDEYNIAMENLMSMEPDDVLIVIGTSLEVYPVSNFPNIALRRGASVIEINQHPVLIGPNVFQVKMVCEEALPLLV